MLFHQVNPQTELRLINRLHAPELFQLLEANREHLRRWHPWVDKLRSVGDVHRTIALWHQQSLITRGIFAGIWFQEKFCGMISHLHVDWSNRSLVLTYWLDEAHQGQGIMTACCRFLIAHAFKEWKFHRVTIECATENLRSRAIPERLGFQLEGITRGIEWLHDHHADHAIYGLLSSDRATKPLLASTAQPQPAPTLAPREAALAQT